MHPPVVTAAAIDSELGGNLHRIAPTDDPAPQQHLVVAGPVLIGGVEKRDAHVDRVTDGREVGIPVGGPVVLAHPPAAKALCGHIETTENCSFHVDPCAVACTDSRIGRRGHRDNGCITPRLTHSRDGPAYRKMDSDAGRKPHPAVTVDDVRTLVR